MRAAGHTRRKSGCAILPQIQGSSLSILRRLYNAGLQALQIAFEPALRPYAPSKTQQRRQHSLLAAQSWTITLRVACPAARKRAADSDYTMKAGQRMPMLRKGALLTLMVVPLATAGAGGILCLNSHSPLPIAGHGRHGRHFAPERTFAAAPRRPRQARTACWCAQHAAFTTSSSLAQRNPRALSSCAILPLQAAPPSTRQP